MEVAKPGLWQRLLLVLYQKLDLVGDQRLLIGERGAPTRNAPAPLGTLWRFIRAQLRARKSKPAVEPVEGFRQQVDVAVKGLGDTVQSCQWFSVKPNADTWLATGIRVDKGDELTILASGMLYILKALDVGIMPATGLWYRFGDGPVRKLIRDRQVIRAEDAGELKLIGAIPGEFADPSGNFETSVPRKPMEGEFTVAVVTWQLSTQHGLSAATLQDDSLFKPVLDNYAAPVTPPEGWKYLWKIGDGEIFKSCEHEEGQSICCHSHHDGGILQYPIEQTFTRDTQLSWSWLMESLPSQLPEHIQPTHDYLSIAIEFDNGLDLTYMWSAELAVDTIFQCPLPWWDRRETHWVLRNDKSDLGKWLDEVRNVYDDYQRAISGPMPSKVVAVWLIANTAFQRGHGDCRYRGISVSNNGHSVQVHP